MSHCLHWTQSTHTENLGICHFPLWKEVIDQLPPWVQDEMKPIDKTIYCASCRCKATHPNLLTQGINLVALTVTGTCVPQVAGAN